MRYDYIKRLIEGTRSMNEENMNKYHAELRELYPECMSAEYLDSSMLADVVEEDLQVLEAANIQEMIFTLARTVNDNDLGMDSYVITDIIDLLNSLKETTRGVASE